MTTHDAPVGYSPNSEFWVKIMRERLDRYRSELTDPAVLDALGPVDGRRILDAGCGEGYLSRILAGLGATATGIDLNAELIDAAVAFEQTEPAGVSYLHGSITDPIDTEADFDACVCNHLLNDIDDIDQALEQIGQVLRPGGQLVALVLHPCFYWQRSGLEETDPEWPAQYFTVRSRLQSFSVAGIESPGQVRAWYRPLEAYAKALASTGYVITNLSEPHPSVEQMSDPWWRDGWKRPMFLVISAKRP